MEIFPEFRHRLKNFRATRSNDLDFESNKRGQFSPNARTDENTNSTWFVYDELDRLVEQIDQNSDPIFYTYDLLGRRTSVEDAVGNVTTFVYDTLGRVIAESIIVSGQTLTRSYNFDGVGNLTRQVDRAGQVRTFGYDENDIRIAELWYTSIAAEAAGTSSYTLNSTYDVAGRLTGVADDFSEYIYLYDNTDRLTTTLDLNGDGQVVTLTNQYVDPNDPAAVRLDNLRIGLMVTLNGITFSQTDYAYDAKLRLTEIHQTDGGGIDYAVRDKRVTFAYDDNNRFDEIRRYQGSTQVVYADYNYDDLSRLEGLTYYDNETSLTTLAFYGFEYDDKGRITKIANVDDTVDYVYDDTDQLLSATYETAAQQSDETFAYDANGNRIGTGITTGDQNQITSDGTFDYEYDANGARTRQIEIATGKVTEYGWDIKKRLVDVDFYDDATDADADQNATKRVGYTRDMYNRVVGKSVDADGDGPGEAVETRYVYDRNQIIIEFTGGEVSGNYLWGPAVDQLLADESFDVNNPADDPDLLWALTDQLNSVRDLVRYDSVAGQTNVVNHIVYDATGNIISETDTSISILIGFTGRPFDRDSGLQDNLNRPYDPGTATFLIVDPSGFYAGDGNLYRYVGNDFVNKIDPSGLAAIEPNWEGMTNRSEAPSLSGPLTPANIGVGSDIVGAFAEGPVGLDALGTANIANTLANTPINMGPPNLAIMPGFRPPGRRGVNPAYTAGGEVSVAGAFFDGFFNDGGDIVVNTYTFGQIDYLNSRVRHMVDTRGGAYAWSEGIATGSRELMITAATMNISAVARGGQALGYSKATVDAAKLINGGLSPEPEKLVLANPKCYAF